MGFDFVDSTSVSWVEPRVQVPRRWFIWVASADFLQRKRNVTWTCFVWLFCNSNSPRRAYLDNPVWPTCRDRLGTQSSPCDWRSIRCAAESLNRDCTFARWLQGRTFRRIRYHEAVERWMDLHKFRTDRCSPATAFGIRRSRVHDRCNWAVFGSRTSMLNFDWAAQLIDRDLQRDDNRW